MIVIFGTTTKGTTERPLLDTYCYSCRRATTWHLYRATEWITGFFIPVVPIHKEYFLFCDGCRDSVKLEKDDAAAVRRLGELPESESSSLHDRLVSQLELHQLSDKTETQREYLKNRNRD